MIDVQTDKIELAMNAAAKDIVAVGIGKTGWNEQQKFKFRGIDQVLNVIGPILAKHAITVTPEFAVHSISEYVTKAGSKGTSVFLSGKFTFRHDGQSVSTTAVGEGRDVADKATNKAMAAAAKYALIMTFVVPLVGSDDTDAHSPESGAESGGHIAISEYDALMLDIRQAEDKVELRHALAAALKRACAVGDVDAHGRFKLEATTLSATLPEGAPA